MAKAHHATRDVWNVGVRKLVESGGTYGGMIDLPAGDGNGVPDAALDKLADAMLGDLPERIAKSCRPLPTLPD